MAGAAAATDMQDSCSRRTKRERHRSSVTELFIVEEGTKVRRVVRVREEDEAVTSTPSIHPSISQTTTMQARAGNMHVSVLGIIVAVLVVLLAMNTASAQSGWNELLVPAPVEEDCLAKAQNVAAMCGSVMQSNDPFDLLNCCTEAQSVNEQRCFCQADVALGLGTSYDLTMEVLQAG